MNKASEIWEQTIPYIKKIISPVAYKTTFEKLKPEYIEDDTLYLSTTDKLFKDMFMIFEERTKSALAESTGKLYNNKAVCSHKQAGV